MTNRQDPSIDEVFFAAMERESPEARAAYLDEVCGADQDLRRRVERLLEAQPKLGSFLDAPAAGPTLSLNPTGAIEGPGTEIGPYKLLEQIGEGGMGVVYMAEQTEPVRRKVALKIIKPGMDTKQVIARFEAERQALALMDHPNIAKVLDAGATESGRPYFVMELVRGVPITEYCDQHRLTIRERLDLFKQVCQAVQHAHQKGIIHRDIKPTNVLVTSLDGVPLPRVIDFGIAKATGQSLTDKTLFTGFAQLIGTPLYMSPEQAELSAVDVDTRSDIYSLGVLLYELLTGTTPFDQDTFRTAALDEVRRIIREDEPPKPSTRLSQLGATTATVSDNRQADARKLHRSLRGELDWIVMKALEKDRRRRYETANDFASDVRRYLTNQPVEAGSPSVGYRLRKFARRNKGPVVAGLALAAMLVLGTVGTSIGLIRALQAEHKATLAAERARTAEGLATDRLLEATREKERATAAEEQAKEEAAVAKAVNDFLQYDLLAQASPGKNARSKKVTVEEVLGRAAAHIAGKFGQQPRIEAAIRLTIGDAYRTLGEPLAAQPHLERAYEIHLHILGEEHRDTLTSMTTLGIVYREQRQYAKAEPLLIKVLEVSRRVLGEEHHDTLRSMNNLALLYQNHGQYAKAEPLLIKVLEVSRRVLGEEHTGTLTCMNNLAMVYKAQNKYAKAQPLLIKVLQVRRRVLGEEDPRTLNSMNNLGCLYRDQAQFANAEPLYVMALQGRRRVLGEENPHTLDTVNHLAGVYMNQGRFAKAEPLYREALQQVRKRHGEASPKTAGALANLGLNLLKQQKDAEAEPLLREGLKFREQNEPDAWTTFNTKSELGGSPLGQKKYAGAEALLLAGYEGMKQREGKIPPVVKVRRLTAAIERLVRLYEAWGQPEKATTWKAKLGLAELPPDVFTGP